MKVLPYITALPVPAPGSFCCVVLPYAYLVCISLQHIFLTFNINSTPYIICALISLFRKIYVTISSLNNIL